MKEYSFQKSIRDHQHPRPMLDRFIM